MSDCPGEGKCHGCVSWCDYCGDVSEVCPDDFRNCDAHYCPTCGRCQLIRDGECSDCYERRRYTGGDPHEKIERRICEAIEAGRVYGVSELKIEYEKAIQKAREKELPR